MVFLYYCEDVKDRSTDEKVSALARYHLLNQNGFAPERLIIERQTKGKQTLHWNSLSESISEYPKKRRRLRLQSAALIHL